MLKKRKVVVRVFVDEKETERRNIYIVTEIELRTPVGGRELTISF